ncbi:MAG: hypothetical protein M1450_03315 [Patescibacteria group bacterium]|nr:hypothetical protein [Patescibacteria group bacterium]
MSIDIMHTFAIISNSKAVRNLKKGELLQKYQIGRFEQIIIGDDDNSIDAIRVAKRQIQFKNTPGKYQALTIENIHKLSLPAQQALLKTLEEPPPNTIIILEAENHEQILPTILSRAEVFYTPSYQVLTQTETKEITAFWSDFFKFDLSGKRLLAASEIITKYPLKEEITAWLNLQIIFFRELLKMRIKQIKRGKNLTPKQISLILRLLISTKKYLLANVNLKLSIDNLFIEMPLLPLSPYAKMR